METRPLRVEERLDALEFLLKELVLLITFKESPHHLDVFAAWLQRRLKEIREEASLSPSELRAIEETFENVACQSLQTEVEQEASQEAEVAFREWMLTKEPGEASQPTSSSPLKAS